MFEVSSCYTEFQASLGYRSYRMLSWHALGLGSILGTHKHKPSLNSKNRSEETTHTFLVRVTIAWMKHHDQSDLGSKRFIPLSFMEQFIFNGRRQEPQRAMEGLFIVAVACSACFLRDARTTHDGRGPGWLINR